MVKLLGNNTQNLQFWEDRRPQCIIRHSPAWIYFVYISGQACWLYVGMFRHGLNLSIISEQRMMIFFTFRS
jgi:hypothetical protein